MTKHKTKGCCSSLCFCLCGAVIIIPFSELVSSIRGVLLGVNLPVRPLWRTILFGEGLELKRAESVFTTSHILHCVLSSAALTVQKQKLCVIYFGQCKTILINGNNICEVYDFQLYQLTCAYSPRPGRKPVGRGHAPAAGSDTAPGSVTWLCGLWRSYSW